MRRSGFWILGALGTCAITSPLAARDLSTSAAPAEVAPVRSTAVPKSAIPPGKPVEGAPSGTKTGDQAPSTQPDAAGTPTPPDTPNVSSEPSAQATESPVLEKTLERERERREEWLRTNRSVNLPKRADAFTLTVSGGVSLGSYEAGLLHTLTEALRRSPGSAKLRVVTGASAGSANALIAGVEACMPTVEEPENSLGYKVWVTVGLDDLFVPGRVTPGSIFVQDALKRGVDTIMNRAREGLPTSCDFALGVTTTREKGYDVKLADGLVVPRLAEHFVLRVQGRGERPAPAFTNYLDPSQSFERPVLPLSHGMDLDARRDGRAIEQIILASAAFPVAFEAQTIEHCTTAPRTSGSLVTPSEPPYCEVATRIDSFVDGGVFDNNPLSLASGIARSGLVLGENGESKFRTLPTGGDEPGPEVVYGYIDPDLRSYALYEPKTDEDEEERDPVLGLLTRLGGQAIGGARGRELADLAERSPHTLQRLWLMEASYPQVSELLGAFFGFFEQDFRDFDFHLGSYEAYRDLRDRSGSMLGAEPFLRSLESLLSGPTSEIPGRYRKLGCMLAHLEPDRHGRLAPLCDGDALRNFRVLLQITINRLWSNCHYLTHDEAAGREHLQCKRAQGGLPLPQVDKEFVLSDDEMQLRRSSEDEFDYAMRLLGAYEFEFRDLGLKRAQAHMGRRYVRRHLSDMVTTLADSQPGLTNRTAVLTVGRTLVNGIEYEPPPKRMYVLLGHSLEFGYLGRLGDNAAWYWNPDARISNLRSLVTERFDRFAGTLALGVELALLPFSGSIVQTSIGTRGGYQFATQDAIGFQRCDEESVSGDSRQCSQPVVEIPINISFLERVRLSAIPLFYPMRQSWGHAVFDLELAVGAELF